jgi:hypothetical protein
VGSGESIAKKGAINQSASFTRWAASRVASLFGQPAPVSQADEVAMGLVAYTWNPHQHILQELLEFVPPLFGFLGAGF